MTHISIEDLILELADKQYSILTGLANPHRDFDQTQFERGKYAELTSIINVLKEKAAE